MAKIFPRLSVAGKSLWPKNVLRLKKSSTSCRENDSDDDIDGDNDAADDEAPRKTTVTMTASTPATFEITREKAIHDKS